MTLFENLLMAHLAGDWIFQTEWQALNKTRSWRALLAHVSAYHLLVLGILLSRFGLAEPRVYLAVALLAVSHALLDRRDPLIWLMRKLRIVVEREPPFWLVMAVDQSVHILLLGLVAIQLTAL